MNNLEIILNLCHLTVNPIDNLLQWRHSRVPRFIPNKPASTTKTLNPHHHTTQQQDHQKQITDSIPIQQTASSRNQRGLHPPSNHCSPRRTLSPAPQSAAWSCATLPPRNCSTARTHTHRKQIKHNEIAATFIHNFPQYQGSQRNRKSK